MPGKHLGKGQECLSYVPGDMPLGRKRRYCLYTENRKYLGKGQECLYPVPGGKPQERTGLSLYGKYLEEGQECLYTVLCILSIPGKRTGMSVYSTQYTLYTWREA